MTCRILSLIALVLLLAGGALWTQAGATDLPGAADLPAPPGSSGAADLPGPPGSSGSATAQPAPPIGPSVRTATVQTSTEHRPLQLWGVTRPAEQAQLGFTQPGRIERRPVALGDRVEAGAVLAVLDQRGVRAGLAAAEAQLAGLEVQRAQLATELDRVERLAAEGAVTQQKQDELHSTAEALDRSIEAARVGRDEAARQVSEATLRAPFAGEVVAVLAWPGEVVAAGMPVVVLKGRGAEVLVEVPQAVYSAVATGSAARVQLDGVGRELQGTVASVGHSPAGPGRLFPVVVTLPETVDSGLSAVVVLRLPVEPSLAVPLRAVADPTGGQPAVWAVDEGVVRRVPVSTGDLLEGRVAISGDIDEGDEVVVVGLTSLADGIEVEVLR